MTQDKDSKNQKEEQVRAIKGRPDIGETHQEINTGS